MNWAGRGIQSYEGLTNGEPMARLQLPNPFFKGVVV